MRHSLEACALRYTVIENLEPIDTIQNLVESEFLSMSEPLSTSEPHQDQLHSVTPSFESGIKQELPKKISRTTQ